MGVLHEGRHRRLPGSTSSLGSHGASARAPAPAEVLAEPQSLGSLASVPHPNSGHGPLSHVLRWNTDSGPVMAYENQALKLSPVPVRLAHPRTRATGFLFPPAIKPYNPPTHWTCKALPAMCHAAMPLAQHLRKLLVGPAEVTLGSDVYSNWLSRSLRSVAPNHTATGSVAGVGCGLVSHRSCSVWCSKSLGKGGRSGRLAGLARVGTGRERG